MVLYPSTYRVKWDIVGDPKVSILIPNKDHTDDLEKCLHGLWAKTSWENFEVIVIENNSTDPATFPYYEQAKQRYDGLQVVTWPGKGFNFSAINNFGRKYATGDYLLLLNNDVEGTADWLTELLRQCAHPGGCGHLRRKAALPGRHPAACGRRLRLLAATRATATRTQVGGSGYMGRRRHRAGLVRRDRCLPAGRRPCMGEVHGLDESFAVAFNDVDFCLRVRDAGYTNVWTPYAQLTTTRARAAGPRRGPGQAQALYLGGGALPEAVGKAAGRRRPLHEPEL